MIKRKSTGIILICFCFIFLLSACDLTQKTNLNNTKTNNKPWKTAYINIITDIMKGQQDQLNNRYYKGALKDLNNDNQEELIVTFLSEKRGRVSYKIYTYESNQVKLLKEGGLLIDVGAARGGINLLDYNKEPYICIWFSNGEAGGKWHEWYICDLYQMKDNNLLKKHTFSFDYYKESSLDTDIINEFWNASKDGNYISFDEFIKTKDIFDKPVKVLCQISGEQSSLALKELIRQIKEN